MYCFSMEETSRNMVSQAGDRLSVKRGVSKVRFCPDGNSDTRLFVTAAAKFSVCFLIYYRPIYVIFKNLNFFSVVWILHFVGVVRFRCRPRIDSG